LDFVRILEDKLGQTAEKELVGMQAGDVPRTFADIRSLKDYTGYHASTTFEDGIEAFVEWYKAYYR
jgi:UDP-glucuronate 4-epimerase